MNQRSLSTRQQRAVLLNDISFEQKISKAIKEKKSVIASMTQGKNSTQQLMAYKLSPFHRNRQNLKTQQALPRKQAVKIVHVSQDMMHSYLEENNIGFGRCANHPSKKAAFEQKYQRNNLYCHECAIKMVRNDVKMIGISQQSLMLRSLVDKQLDKIEDEQNRVKGLIEQYYQETKETFEKIYLDFLESRMHQPQFTAFSSFNDEKSNLERIKNCLGTIEPVTFKFMGMEGKENEPRSSNQQSSFQNISQKQLTISDIGLESDRPVETRSYREIKKIPRSRQNSNYRKDGQKEPRKVLNLR